MNEPKPNEIYKHFKGGKYKIIVVARDCENPERKIVVYEMLYDKGHYEKGTIWVRELNDFCGYKEINGEKIKRFRLIE